MSRILSLASLALAATLPASPPASGSFASDLWTGLGKSSTGNRLVSPYSVSSCLLLLWEGSAGKTNEIVRETLREKDLTMARSRAKQVADSLRRTGGTQIANAVFARPDITLSSHYRMVIGDAYGATAETLKSGHAGVQQVNHWVLKNTKGRIPKLVDSLNPNEAVVLLNAITFDGQWQNAFDPALTKPEPFHAPSPTTVPMMKQNHTFGYAEVGNVRGVVLPYRGQSVVMVVLLQNEPNRGFTEQTLHAVLEKASYRPVDLWLPKFKISDEPDVQGSLQKMGLEPLFHHGDFTPLSPGGKISAIGRIIHRAMVQVDEKGTQAAATTGITMTKSIVMRPLPPVVFHADRPFSFGIVDRSTGTVLFMGAVDRP